LVLVDILALQLGHDTSTPTVPEVYMPCANAELPNKTKLANVELIIAKSFILIFLHDTPSQMGFLNISGMEVVTGTSLHPYLRKYCGGKVLSDMALEI
jgi:hypothetical protein